MAGKHIFGGKSESTAFGAGFLERSFNKDLIYRRKSLCNCEGEVGGRGGKGGTCKISFEREEDSISCWGGNGGEGSELHGYTLSDIVGKV